MGDSETFGVQKGHGSQVVEWINRQAQQGGLKLEARLYGYDLETDNFGTFEMFSWIGDAKQARRMIIRASKRFHVRIIEGGYKPREKIIHTTKSDYAIVRRGDKIVGQLQLQAPLFGRSNWTVKAEERR